MKHKYPKEVREFLKVSNLRGKALQADIIERFGVEIDLRVLSGLQCWYQGRRKKCTPSYLLKPEGTERLDKDGYIRVRVGDSERLKHHLVWEKDHEPLKRNEVIMFKDGDRTNCDISNLMKVERKYIGAINNLIRKERGEGMLETALRLAQLQVTANTKLIHHRKDKPNCQPRTETYHQITELYDAGLMPFEIAKKLGKSLPTIRWALRKHKAVHTLENLY